MSKNNKINKKYITFFKNTQIDRSRAVFSKVNVCLWIFFTVKQQKMRYLIKEQRYEFSEDSIAQIRWEIFEISGKSAV